MVAQAELAVEARELGKAYRAWRGPVWRALEGLTRGRVRAHSERWALRGVDLALPRGGTLGVCGANGAGKSTLLKLLAGTTAPSAGRYRVAGRVASLLELGTGFHPDFSGVENVRLNGVLMGRTRREVEARLGAICDFAELGAAVDAPVRTYSTGMAMRLAFAAALGLEPDVLILDEVFAVGDQYFQRKCVDRLLAVRRGGATIVLCSHSLYDLRQLCEQALWLDGGRVAAGGPVEEVTAAYSAAQAARTSPEASARAVPADWPRVVGARLVRAGDGAEVSEVRTGASLALVVDWENPAPERRPIQLGVALRRQDHTLCAGVATHLDGVALRGASGRARLELPELPLLSGRFQVLVYLFDGDGVHRYQELALPRELVVRSDGREEGLVRLARRWSVEPLVEREAAA